MHTCVGVCNEYTLALLGCLGDSCSRAFDSSVELTIKKANFKINLIEPQNNTFISTVRQKLMWGSDKRN